MTSEQLTGTVLAVVCAILAFLAWRLDPSFVRTACIFGAILVGLGAAWLFAAKYSSR